MCLSHYSKSPKAIKQHRVKFQLLITKNKTKRLNLVCKQEHLFVYTRGACELVQYHKRRTKAEHKKFHANLIGSHVYHQSGRV